MRRVLPFVTITGGSLLVSSCGGGGYGGSCGSYGSYGSYGSCGGGFVGADGLYEGSLTGASSPNGIPVVAIVAENGEGRISGADGSYYRLSVGTTGANLNGSFTAYSTGTGSGSGLGSSAQPTSGTVGGVITSAGLNVTLTDRSNVQQSLALTFDSAYESGSSLATLAGNWTSVTGGLTLQAVIQSDGSFSAVDSNNCTYTGAFSLLDSRFDAYAETHVRSCNGVTVTFTGLAGFFPAMGTGASGPPTEIKLLTDDNAGEALVADFQ